MATVKKLSRLAATTLAAALSIGLGGCDIESLLPATAENAGKPSGIVRVVAGVVGVDDMDTMGMQDVEVEIVDVLLHRASDDAWLVLNSDTFLLDLADTSYSRTMTGIPVGLDTYDELVVTLGRVRVAHGDEWRVADLAHEEVSIPVNWTVTGDTMIGLDFDVKGSIQRNSNAKFRVDATFVTQLLPQ